MDTSAPSRVIAHHLEIVDDQGRPRIVLETLLGLPRLVLMEANGSVQAEFTVDKEGRPSATFRNPTPGGPSIGLEVDQKGAHLKLHGPGQASAYMFLNNEGGSGAVLVDDRGVRRLEALVEVGGKVRLEQFGSDGSGGT